MDRGKHISIFVLLNALALCFSGGYAGADAGKGQSSLLRYAAWHSKGKAPQNTNNQWSADPERGWVRADEHRELHRERRGAEESHQNRGKQKGKNHKGNSGKRAK